MARYGCELCGNEEFYSYGIGPSRFAGDRQADACTNCCNEWARLAHTDETHRVVFTSWLASELRSPGRAGFAARLTPHEAQEQATEAIQASAALGELWDAWAQRKREARAKAQP